MRYLFIVKKFYNPWAYDDNNDGKSHSANRSIFVALIFPSTILLPIIFVVIVVSVKLAWKWRSKRKRRVMIWEDNVLYNSTKSLNNETNDFCFGDEDWMLPIWLQNKKDMIFYHSSVIKGDLLGRGQFGAVYKGKLVQGSAV